MNLFFLPYCLARWLTASLFANVGKVAALARWLTAALFAKSKHWIQAGGGVLSLSGLPSVGCTAAQKSFKDKKNTEATFCIA